MTDTLRMKGKAENGRTIEFGVRDILSVRVYRKRNGSNVAHIDPHTIQLDDDPRKAMINRLQAEIEMLPVIDGLFVCLREVKEILDEMEAKL